ERNVAAPQDRGLRLEAAGEDDAIARDGLAPAVALNVHGLDLIETPDGDEFRTRQHGHAEDMARDPVAGPAGAGGPALLQHGRDRDSAVARGQQGRERYQLRADDDGARERPSVREIDELLQGAGGRDAPGSRARDEARAARRFANPGRQQDAAAGDGRGSA